MGSSFPFVYSAKNLGADKTFLFDVKKWPEHSIYFTDSGVLDAKEAYVYD